MSFSTRFFSILSVLFFLFLQQELIVAHSKFGHIHKKCHDGDGKSPNMLHRLNTYLQGGSDDSFFNDISSFFRGKHISSTDRKTMECLHAMFLTIENNFKLLSESIKLLSVQQTMINTLLEAREVMDDIYVVFLSLEDYKTHRENSSRRRLIYNCRKYDPGESLAKLYLRAITEPRLFDTILLGTEYTVQDFERISNAWLKQAAMCTVLARECNFFRQSSASEAYQNHLNQRIHRHLTDIRDAYLLARDSMTVNFVLDIPHIIRRELHRIATDGSDLTTGATKIYDTLAAKFPFRAWVVMLYERVDFNLTDVHAHESSTNNSFLINDALHTAVVHSSDRSLNCSLFMTSVRRHQLKRLFADSDEYAQFVTHKGHLGNDIGTIRQLLIEHNNDLPQNYFISVVRYDWRLSGVAVKQEYEFHHFEHMRHPDTNKLKKSVLLGWC